MKLRTTLPITTFIRISHFAAWTVASHALAQNLVTNGGFDANAAAFTQWPGYLGGSNPSSIPGWQGGGMGINGSSTSLPSSPFGPVNNAPHYAFIQGNNSMAQPLSSPLTVGQSYLFSFEGAARNGAGTEGYRQPSGVQVFANNHHGTPDLVLDGGVTGSWWLDHLSFQKYAFAFNATESSQAIQFNSVGPGDHTTNIDNVSVTPISSAITVPVGTTFFTQTSGTVGHSFSLPGGQIFQQRPGSVTYTGNITGTGNGGSDAWSIHSAGSLAGSTNLTFSGSTISLGNKVLSIRGDQANNPDGVSNAIGPATVAAAQTQKTTFHNVNLTTTSEIWITRAAVEFSGNSVVNVGGQIREHGFGDSWILASMTIRDNAAVTVSGGLDFKNRGDNLALNGGTLTTPWIRGNNNDSMGSKIVFNGTRVVATQNNADFLRVSTAAVEEAEVGTAHIGNGGAIFDTQGFDINISPPLADLPGNAGTLQKLGLGLLSLGGLNTYSGGTTVSEGRLRAYNPNALGSGAVTVASGGSVMLWWNTGSATISNNFILNGPGAPSLVGTGTKSAIYADGGSGGGFAEYTLSGTITLATNSSLGGTYDNQLRVTGQITGPGGLAKGADRADENGTLILANPANNYAGDTTINRGTIRLAANEVIPHGVGFGNVNLSTSTTLDLAGFSETINGLTGSGSVTLGVAGQSGALTVGAGNVSSSFGGAISGNGTLTKTGSGTLTLTSSNSHNGATSVSGGVLRLDHSTALPGGIGASGGTSSLNLSGGVVGLGAGNFTRGLGTGANQVQFTGSGGFAAFGADRTVNLGGASAGVTWASGSFIPDGSSLILGAAGATHKVDFQNPINLAGAARTVQVNNGAAAIDAVLSGALTGTGASGLTKTGDGTLTLTGTNDYKGLTTVANGTLVINGNQVGATGAVSVENGAKLAGIGTVGGATTIQSGGTHAPGNSPGVQTFAGDLTYAGGSIFEWELAGSASGARDSGYDGVNVGGDLGGSDAIFKVVLNSGSFADPFWDANRQWSDIFKNGGSSLSMEGIFGSFEYWQGGTNLTSSVVANQGYFTVSGSSLNWNAVPEPTGAVAGLLLGAGLLRRQRKARRE
jgi:autotransporter-associated beta strand protein